MVIAQNTQYSWSPEVWALALTGMVFFVLALSLVLILMVHRASEATAPFEDEVQASPASSASTSAEVQTGRTSPVPSG